MAGSKCAYLQNAALNGVLGGPQFTLPGSGFVYIALSTAAFTSAATGASLTEVNAGGYSRVQVAQNTSNWPNAVNASKANNAVFTFPSATANWGTVLSFYIIDASSSGNALYGADLTTSRTINSGDTASFAVGSITLTEN